MISYDLTRLLFVFLVILLENIVSVLCVTCRFFPYYPISPIGFRITCPYSCCSGFPLTRNATCCGNATTTDDDDSSDEPWVIALSVIGAFLLICFAFCVVCIGMAIKNAKRDQRNLRVVYSRHRNNTIGPTSNSNSQQLPTIDSEVGYPPLYSEINHDQKKTTTIDELPNYESVVIQHQQSSSTRMPEVIT